MVAIKTRKQIIERIKVLPSKISPTILPIF